MTPAERAERIINNWAVFTVHDSAGDALQILQETALEELTKAYEANDALQAKYNALRTARPFTAGRPVFELPIKDVGGTMLKQ